MVGLGIRSSIWQATCPPLSHTHSMSPCPQDVAELEARLGRKLEKAERARIGVGQLRRFLEHRVQRRYLEVRGCGGCRTVSLQSLGRMRQQSLGRMRQGTVLNGWGACGLLAKWLTSRS